MVKLIFKAYKKTDKIIFYIFFSLHINMLTGYHQENKERLSKKVLERYQNFSEEEKDKRRQYTRQRIEIFLKTKKKEASICS